MDHKRHLLLGCFVACRSSSQGGMEGHLTNHFLQPVSIRACSRDDFVNRERVRRREFPRKGVTQKMAGKSLGEALFLIDNSRLEVGNSSERIPAPQRSGSVNRPAIFVFLAPAAGNVKILEREAKWVDL